MQKSYLTGIILLQLNTKCVITGVAIQDPPSLEATEGEALRDKILYGDETVKDSNMCRKVYTECNRSGACQE